MLGEQISTKGPIYCSVKFVLHTSHRKKQLKDHPWTIPFSNILNIKIYFIIYLHKHKGFTKFQSNRLIMNILGFFCKRTITSRAFYKIKYKWNNKTSVNSAQKPSSKLPVQDLHTAAKHITNYIINIIINIKKLNRFVLMFLYSSWQGEHLKLYFKTIALKHTVSFTLNE